MILEFVLSLITIFGTTELCLFISGGWWTIINEWTLVLGVIAIFSVMMFLSGYGKSFLKIFYSRKKIENVGLSELKKMEKSIDYACKILIYICFFFMFVASVYFYLNFMETQTLGCNLAIVMCSVIYLAFGEVILLVLKGKLREKIILFMAEDSDFTKIESSKTKKNIISNILKIVFSIVIIFGFYLLVIYSNIVNHSESEPLSLHYLCDIPGIVFAFIPPFILLAISGCFCRFFNAISVAFKSVKLSVVQKGLYYNAIKTFRLICFSCGVLTALISYMGIMCNLENKAFLGINFAVGSVPMFYTLFINLILLPVESKVCRLCDSE